jgi:hypothetical protein
MICDGKLKIYRYWVASPTPNPVCSSPRPQMGALWNVFLIINNSCSRLRYGVVIPATLAPHQLVMEGKSGNRNQHTLTPNRWLLITPENTFYE